MPDFHNPYNFVRTPGRNVEHPFAGDYDPSEPGREEDHSRYWPDLYTGTIPVRLRTRTPLFLTDPSTKDEDANGHSTFDCLDYIPATALKGMLSSAYEIITNSRYRVFSEKQHSERLTFRSTELRRRLRYNASPWDCLNESLRPAQAMSELSPADRLFGWVAQGESGAWRGKVRISDGIYKGTNAGETAVTIFNERVPLSILGTPKPSQARFYLGNQNGAPQGPRLTKEAAGYERGKKLRGRKVYLHHLLPGLSREQKAQYWNPDAKVGNPEYRHTESSDQNRSITGWIAPRKDFFFEIRVENLTAEELGAVLTLLKGRDCCFRLGFGKPLGLGSIALSIATPEGNPLPVVKGCALAPRYHDFDEPAPLSSLSAQEQRQIMQAYQRAIVDAYSEQTQESPTFDRCRWMALDFAGDLSADDRAEFERAWNEALDRGDAAVQLDKLPSKEEFTELYPELLQKLAILYAEEAAALRAQNEYDFGWSTLSFIDEFMRSMQGFDDADVHYPRSAQEEEGYQWFTENEKARNRLTLPPIGNTLPSF